MFSQLVEDTESKTSLLHVPFKGKRYTLNQAIDDALQ